MAGHASIHFGNAVLRDYCRWIWRALGLTVLVWLAGLGGLLAIAGVVHNDVPMALAAKLPLLHTHPHLIFAGDSRAELQLDPALAAHLIGEPGGAVVNIGYLAGEPLAVLAAARLKPDVFSSARLVISVTALISNEGNQGAVVFPPDVTARMSVGRQLTTFLPMRIGTLIRYIRDAFDSRFASDENMADAGPMPPRYGLNTLSRQPNYSWPPDISSHEHYRKWDISGFKAAAEIGALCDLAKVTRRLTVVRSPWAPRYDRNREPSWKEKDEQHMALIQAAAQRCGFDVLDLQVVPGLTDDNFADEQHINETGVPVYTRYVMSQLKP
jgi:hypothetical protein